MSRFLKAALATSLLAAPAFADAPLGLGREALPEEIAAWDIDIRPDGLGLPEGRGDVWMGEELYEQQCAVCHGTFGEGVGAWPYLAGGEGTLTDEHPTKTIGSYWPYLSTVWDYVNRAMPYGYAQSLQPDEVYAITAYLLYLNFLVDDDFELSHENFTEIRLPNEDGFYLDDRIETEWPTFTAEPCMTDCFDEPAQITMRAVVLDVTPDDPTSRPHAISAQPEAAAEAAPAAPDAALIASGEALFRQCAACHQIGTGAQNRVGPHLNDLMDRPVGGLDGYRYSGAMEAAGSAGMVWDHDTLDAFLADPRGHMPGNRMAYQGMASADDRAALIAYLAHHDD